MSDDLGKGDVVEATSDMSVSGMWTGHGPYVIHKGTRAIIAEVVKAKGVCTGCGCRPDVCGLKLEEYPLRPHVLWCPCEWKKIGPGEAETLAKFAHHLKPARTPVRERA